MYFIYKCLYMLPIINKLKNNFLLLIYQLKEIIYHYDNSVARR